MPLFFFSPFSAPAPVTSQVVWFTEVFPMQFSLLGSGRGSAVQNFTDVGMYSNIGKVQHSVQPVTRMLSTHLWP
jgi:hypothetical protein